MSKIEEKIKDYCSLNNLNYDKIYNKALMIGFNYIKYGDKPTNEIKNNNIIDNSIEQVEDTPLIVKKENTKDLYGE